MKHRRLINNLVKPWEELNILLSKPFALQPEECDYLVKVEALCVAVSHYPEHLGMIRKNVDNASEANKKITDIADASKHKKLSSDSRNNYLRISCDFEFRENNANEDNTEFRFLRNTVTAYHNTYGELDVMLVLRDAIRYLLSLENVEIPKFGNIMEGLGDFLPKVYLEYDGSLGVVMNDFQVRFMTINTKGVHMLGDPPNGWSFTLRDISKSNKRG